MSTAPVDRQMYYYYIIGRLGLHKLVPGWHRCFHFDTMSPISDGRCACSEAAFYISLQLRKSRTKPVAAFGKPLQGAYLINNMSAWFLSVRSQR